MTSLLPNCGCCVGLSHVVKILLPGMGPCNKMVTMTTDHDDEDNRNGNNNQDKVHIYDDLDNGNGSDPSLTSRDGQSKASSADLSKRTLHSEDEINGVATTTPTSTKVQVASIHPGNGHVTMEPENHVTSNYVSSRIMSIERDLFNNINQEDASVHQVIDMSPNATSPSYLKLSCAVSGYKNADSDVSRSSLGNKNIAVGNQQQRGLKRSDPGSVDDNNLSNKNYSVHQMNGHPGDLVMNGDCGSHSNSKLFLHSNGSMGVHTQQPESFARNSVDRDLKKHDVSLSINGAYTSDTHRADTQRVSDTQGVDTTDSSSLSRAADLDIQLTPSNSVKSSPKSGISTPNKDGAYFLQVVDAEERRLKQLCAQSEKHLQDNIPEEACGRIRATIGKANLLTSKKFKQFRGLCNKNLSQSESEPFQTTSQDLAGFWDLVLIQVEELLEMFHSLDQLRENGWNSPVREQQSSISSKVSGNSQPQTPKSSKGPKDKTNSGTSTPKSSKVKEAAKAREEARKRLLAAKRAGRQRKASQSDDVEIFVS